MKDYDAPFGEESQAEQNTALWNALHSCAEDMNFEKIIDLTSMVYDYLESTPRTSLVVELVNKLNEMGYQIVKK